MSIQEIKVTAQFVFQAAASGARSGLNSAKQFVIGHAPRSFDPVPLWVHDLIQDIRNSGARTAPRSTAGSSTCIASIVNFAAAARGEISSFVKNGFDAASRKWSDVCRKDSSKTSAGSSVDMSPQNFQAQNEELEKFRDVPEIVLKDKHSSDFESENDPVPFAGIFDTLPLQLTTGLREFFSAWESEYKYIHAGNLLNMVTMINSGSPAERIEGIKTFEKKVKCRGPMWHIVNELICLQNFDATKCDADRLLQTRIGSYTDPRTQETNALLLSNLDAAAPPALPDLQFDEEKIFELLSRLQNLSRALRRDVDADSSSDEGDHDKHLNDIDSSAGRSIYIQH